jgi:mannan polymerase II complex MNN10 subunit
MVVVSGRGPDTLETPAHDMLHRWLDSDAIIMNHHVPLEMFLPPDALRDTRLILTKDQNGINAGIYFIKVDRWSLQLLAEVIAFRSFFPDVELKFSEQSATIAVLDSPEHKPHYVIAPRHFFNVYLPNGIENERPAVPGDFIIHFAGRGPRTDMSDYLSLVQSVPWNLPLDQLETPREVTEFWENLANRRTLVIPNEATNTVEEP